MLDMEMLGYFLFMEQMEQEQKENEDLREVVLEDATQQDKEE